MNWCEDHPRFSGKRIPESCPQCFKLYFYKNPESKEGLMRVYREAEGLKADL